MFLFDNQLITRDNNSEPYWRRESNYSLCLTEERRREEERSREEREGRKEKSRREGEERIREETGAEY